MDAIVILENLRDMARRYDAAKLCAVVLDDYRFPIWSGSSKPHLHHYGKGGLIIHTSEVIKLCLSNNQLLNTGINERLLFLAALFHDAGKMWDYAPVDPTMVNWYGTEHKRKIHHISRSALVWSAASHPTSLTQLEIDEVLHAILAHHGQREWGSPVRPATRLAWMLHLCDGISARMNDVDKIEAAHVEH